MDRDNRFALELAVALVMLADEQGKLREAKDMGRELLGRLQRVLGKSNALTLRIQSLLDR